MLAGLNAGVLADVIREECGSSCAIYRSICVHVQANSSEQDGEDHNVRFADNACRRRHDHSSIF